MNTDNTLNVLMQTDEKRHRFFVAWLRGVQLLGPEYFGPKSPLKAKHPSDLTPKSDMVEAVIPTLSGGEQQLLAAMASFSAPAGMTLEANDASGAGPNGVALSSADATLAAAGATGTSTPANSASSARHKGRWSR